MKDFTQFIAILCYWGVSIILRMLIIILFYKDTPALAWGFVLCLDLAVYGWGRDHWQTRKLWGYIAAVMIALPPLADLFVGLFLLVTKLSEMRMINF